MKQPNQVSRVFIPSLLSLFVANACIVNDSDDDESGAANDEGVPASTSGSSGGSSTGTTTTGADTSDTTTTGGTGTTAGETSADTTASSETAEGSETADGSETAEGSETADGGETGADPDLPCGPAGDIHEDNDAADQATAVTLTEGKATLLAGVDSNDADFFAITSDKSDPVVVEVSYTVEDMGAADLSMELRNAAGEIVDADIDVREGDSETMSLSWPAMAGETDYIHVFSNDAACVAYDLMVDAMSCTDAHEDNDGLDSPAQIDFGRSAIDLSVHPDDPDYFEFSVPKADPALIKVSYANADADPNLTLRILDSSGQEVGDSTRIDEGMGDVILLQNWIPPNAGETYVAEITSLSDAPMCADYALDFEQCTDAFEDNDMTNGAHELAMGEQTATISDIDKDYYSLTEPPAKGECVVTYSATTGEDMSLILFEDGSIDPIDEDFRDKIEDTEVMKVSWDESAARPLLLWVQAADKRCTEYTIDCHAVE